MCHVKSTLPSLNVLPIVLHGGCVEALHDIQYVLEVLFYKLIGYLLGKIESINKYFVKR